MNLFSDNHGNAWLLWGILLLLSKAYCSVNMHEFKTIIKTNHLKNESTALHCRSFKCKHLTPLKEKASSPYRLDLQTLRWKKKLWSFDSFLEFFPGFILCLYVSWWCSVFFAFCLTPTKSFFSSLLSTLHTREEFWLCLLHALPFGSCR